MFFCTSSDVWLQHLYIRDPAIPKQSVYLRVVWTSASKGYRHKKNSNQFVTPENVCLLTSLFLVTRFQAISVHYRPIDSHSYLLLSSFRLSHVQNSTTLILNFLYMLYFDVSVVMTSKMHFSDVRRDNTLPLACSRGKPDVVHHKPSLYKMFNVPMSQNSESRKGVRG